jgi:predicted PurR-regulated permease PerM
VDELKFLIDKIPDIVRQSQLFFGNIIARLNEVGIEIEPNILASTITSYLGNIMNGIVTTFGQIGRGVRDIVILLYNFILIPLSAYLFLADRDKMSEWIRCLFPAEERDKINGFIDRLNVSLARYFRGQIVFMMIVGFIVGTSLWILGIRYYVLLGLIAALGNLIPNIGFVMSFIPAILVGIFSPAPWVNTVKIAAVFLGEQLLENFVLGPMIIGKASRLHPVAVMVVLVLGGAIFGVWGVILAVPITVFVREFLNHFLGMHL